VKSQLSVYEEIFDELPKTLKDVTNIMKKVKMKIELTTPEIELLVKKLNRISNRLSFSITLLSFSILMVGMIIGTSLSGHIPVLLTKIPAVEIGLCIATAMFLWLLYSIFKSGKF
jgi:ubiquinone biosynthesis protein